MGKQNFKNSNSYIGHSNGSDLTTVVVRPTETMMILSDGAVAHKTIWWVSIRVSIVLPHITREFRHQCRGSTEMSQQMIFGGGGVLLLFEGFRRIHYKYGCFDGCSYVAAFIFFGKGGFSSICMMRNLKDNSENCSAPTL